MKLTGRWRFGLIAVAGDDRSGHVRSARLGRLSCFAVEYAGRGVAVPKEGAHLPPDALQEEPVPDDSHLAERGEGAPQAR